jgi:predicted cupin superfamily sugar epimerase
MNKRDLIEGLSLVEHREGGYFAETYRSQINIVTDRPGCDRSLITSIYYMLTDDRPISYFHCNQSDIIHYFQAGWALTYLLISPQGKLEKIKLGGDVTKGEVLQLIVPGGYWKATVLERGEFGLLGEAVAPGFDYQDSQFATAEYFQSKFPNLWEDVANYIKV